MCRYFSIGTDYINDIQRRREGEREGKSTQRALVLYLQQFQQAKELVDLHTRGVLLRTANWAKRAMGNNFGTSLKLFGSISVLSGLTSEGALSLFPTIISSESGEVIHPPMKVTQA